MVIKGVERRVGGFVSEFWKFAAKGNIFDLAIGVILGNAFSAIVNSLVADIIMPVLSIGTGNINFSELSYTLRPGFGFGESKVAPIVLNYGHLLQVSINFIIIALSIFMFFKLIMNIRKRLERSEKAEPAVPISTQEKLLCEIRDLLKEQAQKKGEPRV